MYSRTRTKGALERALTPANTVMKYFNGNTVSYASPTKPLFQGGPHVETSDVVTPGFTSKRANGDVICNPFKTVRQKRTYVDAAFAHVRDTPLYSGESSGAVMQIAYKSALQAYGSCLSNLQPEDPYGPDWTALSSMMLSNSHHADIAYQMAIGGVAKPNALLLVTVAELKKTLALLLHYASALRKANNPLYNLYLRAKRGKVSRDDWIRIISSEWMAYRYGVMPTLYEIQGVVKALTEPPLPERQTSRGKSEWEDTFTREFRAPSGPYQAFNLKSVTGVKASVRAGVLYAPKLDTLTSRLGLHLSALPETAFELVKWSWMADWFMNLSDSVRSLSATVYGEFLCGWVTERVEGITTHSVADGFPGAQSVIVSGISKPTTWTARPSASSATASSSFTIVKRTPMGDMLPRMPHLRVNMNAARAADLLAVIAQQYLGFQGLVNLRPSRI